MSTAEASSPAGTLIFIDAIGGGLAALGASVARTLGHDAAAATTVAPGPLAQEVADTLKEAGMKVPSVVALAEIDLAGATCIFLGDEPVPAAIAGAEPWGFSLYPAPIASQRPARDGTDERALERMAAARMVRDRIERRLEALRGRDSNR